MNTQTQAHIQAHTQPRIPPRMERRTRDHRRIMLVTTRCTTLLAVQRACRVDAAVQFRFCTGPAAAMRALDHFRADAVLLDVACADRAGVELTGRVRGMEGSPTVAVLADTVGPRMRDAVEHVGADGGLPVMAPDLLDRLGALTSRPVETRADVA